MALTDEVQNRYSSQLLINASNPQDSTATAIDSTRLNNSIADVEAAFKIHAGVTYDNSVDTHVLVATEGVYIRLQVLTGQASREDWNGWKNELEALSLVTSRDRIDPTTDSTLTPTADTVGLKPVSDKEQWRNYIPDAPAGSTTTDGAGNTTLD